MPTRVATGWQWALNLGFDARELPEETITIITWMALVRQKGETQILKIIKYNNISNIQNKELGNNCKLHACKSQRYSQVKAYSVNT